jgi:hypothetical protein
VIKQPERLSREEIQQAHRRVVAALLEHEMGIREVNSHSHPIH